MVFCGSEAECSCRAASARPTEKNCHAERVVLQKGERTLTQEKVWQNTMLVIDTTAFYFYDFLADELTFLKNLDEIRTEGDIEVLRKKVTPLLQ